MADAYSPAVATADDFDAAGITRALGVGTVPVTFYAETDSTSTRARADFLFHPGGHGLYVAASQTGGRGRQGKAFFSPAGDGLYMTLRYCTVRPFPEWAFLTCAVSVAAAEAVAEVTGVECGIKWVNDLYVRERKVCGILTEFCQAPEGERCVLVGIGINLRGADFPVAAGRAGSLGLTRDLRIPLCATLTRSLLRLFAAMEGGTADRADLLRRYRERSILLGRQINYVQNGTVIPATVLGIREDGALLVRGTDGRECALQSGEISIRFPDGQESASVAASVPDASGGGARS